MIRLTLTGHSFVQPRSPILRLNGGPLPGRRSVEADLRPSRSGAGQYAFSETLNDNERDFNFQKMQGYAPFVIKF